MKANSQTGESSSHPADPRSADKLPLRFCLEHRIAIIGELTNDDPHLDIAACDASDARLEEDLKDRLGREIRFNVMEEPEIRRRLAAMYNVPIPSAGGILLLDREESRTDSESVLDDVLLNAIDVRATDIHFEIFESDVSVRLRIDGRMRPLESRFSRKNAARVVSRLKVLCRMDLTEHRIAQEGRMSAIVKDKDRARKIDMRLTVLPGPYGEEAVVRTLDPNRFILELEELSMPPKIQKAYRKVAKRPHGLLLTTGPTASGKTSTLYATIQMLNHREVKIVTVEDPVEYELAGVTQKSVDEKMGFADFLKAYLRSNPDVILVGEIRDPETAEIAVRAATTGHLVISTVHTADAIAAIERLRILGVSNKALAEVLIGVLGQRLIRRLCEACRKERSLPPQLVSDYYRKPPKGTFFGSVGCDRCLGTGFRGLVGIYELFQPTPDVREAMQEGKSVEWIRKRVIKDGWNPLVHDALRKVQQGVTTLEEVARRIPPYGP